MYILENISKKYTRRNKDIYALKDFNLKINDGDFLVIKGESGSGKSTLLSLLAGIQTASSGKVYLDGKNLGQLSEEEISSLLKSEISYIPQGYSLLPNLSVLDNIRFSMSKDKDIKDIINLTKELKISDLIRAFPDELSGGEQKRVAIARALLQNTNIILADEPTADLDGESTKIIWSIFKKINLQGKTVVVVTHEEMLAQEGKKIIYLENIIS